MNSTLYGIDDIPWSRLLAVYRTAEGIPDAIRRLADAPTEEAAIQATKCLENELEHQDSITQATPFATPFLINLLDTPSAITTPRVLSLLKRFYLASQFILESNGVGFDDIRNPEQYRNNASTLWNGIGESHDHDRFTRQEMFAWDCLVITDITNARDSIKKLATDHRKCISDAANALLDAIEN